jgi:hypothetical protein
MDEFSFQLKTFPDRMAITSSLGNMQGVSPPRTPALLCVLPPRTVILERLGGIPNRQRTVILERLGGIPDRRKSWL